MKAALQNIALGFALVMIVCHEAVADYVCYLVL